MGKRTLEQVNRRYITLFENLGTAFDELNEEWLLDPHIEISREASEEFHLITAPEYPFDVDFTELTGMVNDWVRRVTDELKKGAKNGN